MRAVRKCCICCYPRLWSKKVDDGFASEATVPWNDNILRVLDWGLGSNRAERFDFSLWKFPKVFLSSLVPDGARWCQMVPDGARCASEVFGHGHDGHDELDLEDPTPSLETQSQTYRWERGILGTSGNDEILSISYTKSYTISYCTKL